MREPVMTPKDGIALVTGASSGIGRALTLALVRKGWCVAALARREEDLAALAREAAGPGRVMPVPADITDRAGVGSAIARIEAEGPLALAVLNAGIYLPLEVPRFDASVVERSVAVNLLGTSYCLEAIVPAMGARRRGHIAIVSSVTGYGGLPTSGAYGATKAALINLAEAMKIELDRHGVRVSVINPGFVETPAQDDNAFPKPFMISAEEAAGRIVRGLRSQAFEITFPKRFTWQLKLLGLLPARTRLELVKKRTGWAEPV
ncbi:MAG: SDR family NAD(P)-dependent oxidoreductase [Alphaproteobacteria bacterium]|nr:SDR family NAD(P)-dependent oxidoreductase [Alphaproteobacteria bacterium]